MALTQKQVKDVCFVNGGHAACRYLDSEIDDNGNRIYVCKKLSPDKKIINEELVDFLNEMRKSGQDPTKQGVPLADNCQGYVVLKTKPQGYDAKD